MKDVNERGGRNIQPLLYFFATYGNSALSPRVEEAAAAAVKANRSRTVRISLMSDYKMTI